MRRCDEIYEIVTVYYPTSCVNTTKCPTTTSTSTSTSSTTTTTTTICFNCTPHNVTIGTQIWTGCNLDVTTYVNGDSIPEVTDPTEWKNLTTGAWCYYANNSANGPIYGKLYNWYAVNDHRGLAPEGYHIPTKDELITLTDYLGGLSVAGGKLKEEGLCHWESPNTNATNESGFTGFGSGNRHPIGYFENIGRFSFCWSSIESEGGDSWALGFGSDINNAFINGLNSIGGLSVRLIKDQPTTTTTSSTSTSSTTTSTTTLPPTTTTTTTSSSTSTSTTTTTSSTSTSTSTSTTTSTTTLPPDCTIVGTVQET